MNREYELYKYFHAFDHELINKSHTKNLIKMEKIEIETQEIIKHRKEIKLPYFSGNDCHCFKVINEINCLSVCHAHIGDIDETNLIESIKLVHVDLAFENGLVEIMESEFIEKFNKVNEYLKQLVYPSEVQENGI